MNQEELLNFLKPKMIKAYISPKNQEKLIQYLTGVTDQFPKLPELNNQLYFYEFLDVIIGQFHGEAGEMAKRAYFILTKLCPEKLLNQNRYASHVYQIYSEAGVEDAFAARDLIKRIQDFVNGYSRNYLKKLKEAKKAMLENRPASSELGEAFLYYGDMLEKMTVGWKTKITERTRTEKMEMVTLNALSVFWYREEEKKQKLYLKKTENSIYSLMKSLYGTETDEIRTKIFSEDSEKLYQKTKKAVLEMKGNKEWIVVFAVAYLLQEKSLQLKELLQFLFAVSRPKEYASALNENVEKLHQILEEFQMPLETHIKLSCSSIYFDGLEKVGETEGKRLTEYYKKDAALYMDTVQRLEAPDFFPAYAVLCRENKDMELQKLVRKAYVLFLKKKESSHVFQVYYQGELEPLPQFLKEEKVSELGEIVFQSRYEINETEIFYTTFLLYDVLEEARKMTAVLIKKLYQNSRSDFGLKIYLAQQKGFFPNSEASQELYLLSIYEKLGSNIGIPLLIRLFAEDGEKGHKQIFLKLVKNHLPDAKMVFEEAVESQDGSLDCYIDLLYSEENGLPYDLLCRAMEHKLKSIVNYMESFLADKEMQTRPFIEKYKKSKNKNTKEAVERLLKLWDKDKIAKELSNIKSREELVNYITAGYEKNNKKKIPFSELLDFSSVHYLRTEEKADPRLLEYYISEYMLLKQPQKIQTCEKIREFLAEEELRVFLKGLYEHWLEEGADTKYKNLLVPYLISAKTSDITDFKKQLDTWTENARGALAAFGVSAMAFNSMDLTLLLIDTISKKYKNKQVKAAAQNAMEEAAKALGITKEALGDKIIPDLGFNQKRERWFDYGTRKFKGILTEKLEVLVYDETGKQLKNLPKPGAKDQKEVAEKTYEFYKDLKKQLKTVVSNQKIRLEEAIMTGRKWKLKDWEQLFVHNPVMNGFAIGLIWEECSLKGSLTGTFRYMEDGSFNSIEEEEYELSEDSEIMLLHPLDVPEEVTEKWKEQLTDYEIEQPALQLSMPVFELNSEELENTAVNRFEGKQVYFGTIRSVMEKYGWQKTSVLDAGGYEGYYYEDSSANIGIQMFFDFLYVGMAADELVTIKTIQFYEKGKIEYGSYVYDEINDQNRIFPKAVPKKLMSFALMIGEQIAKKAV